MNKAKLDAQKRSGNLVTILDSIIDKFKEQQIPGDSINCNYLSPKYGVVTFVIHLDQEKGQK